MKQLTAVFMATTLVIVSLLITSVPVHAQQSEDEQCDQDALCVELRAYGQTYGDEALRQHVEQMLLQTVLDALEPPPSGDGGGGDERPQSLPTTKGELLAQLMLKALARRNSYAVSLRPGGTNTGVDAEPPRERCIRIREEACNETFNGEMFDAYALGATVLAGCGAATAGTGLAICAMGVMVSLSARQTASRSRQQGCYYGAVADCESQYR
jgi:hypothetical protein